jgi:hypothetical protein
MTQTFTLPTFRSRTEGDQHVIFVPDTNSYFVADQTTFDILDQLRAGASVAEATGRIAGPTTNLSDRVLLVENLVRRLRGELVPPTPGPLSIRPLSEVIGDAADRCETFGMPL